MSDTEFLVRLGKKAALRHSRGARRLACIRRIGDNYAWKGKPTGERGVGHTPRGTTALCGLLAKPSLGESTCGGPVVRPLWGPGILSNDIEEASRLVKEKRMRFTLSTAN